MTMPKFIKHFIAYNALFIKKQITDWPTYNFASDVSNWCIPWRMLYLRGLSFQKLFWTSFQNHIGNRSPPAFQGFLKMQTAEMEAAERRRRAHIKVRRPLPGPYVYACMCEFVLCLSSQISI